MKKYTVDRFEGDFAVLLLREDETFQLDIPKEQLPAEVREGDIIEMAFDSDHKVTEASILKYETESARKKAEDLLKKLLDKNN